MRFTGFKTKFFFTFGIYWWVWHSRVIGWLREEFDPTIEGQETWRLLIPFYSLVIWWRYLSIIRRIETESFAASDYSRGGKPLSVGRAFFWSSLWFAAGPYCNRHLNALDAYRRGQMSQQSAPAAVELVA
jgi:hypothetical protein